METGFVDFNQWVFGLTVAAFLLIGCWGFWKIKSPFDFFHIGDDTKLKKFFFFFEVKPNNLVYLIISLTAANISLGTGFVYFLVAVSKNGILFILIPISVVTGYFWLSSFLNSLPKELSEGKNLIDSFNTKISEQIGKPSYFKKFLSYSLIAVFCLVLSFEIFASSSIIATVIFNNPDVALQVKISIVITLIALVYTTLGGMKGVVRTDILQLIFIVFSFIGLLYFLLKQDGTTIKESLTSIVKLSSPEIWVGVITASILAIATQFYSLINMGIVTHLETAKRGKLLKWGGSLSAFAFILIFIISALNHNSPNSNPLVNFLTTLSVEKSKTLAFFLIVGFASIVFSTIDTVMITIGMFSYDNIENKNSKLNDTNYNEVNKIRLRNLLFFAVLLLLLGFFNFYHPDIFYLLLGLGSPVAILAPMIYLAGMLSRKNQLGKLSNNACIFYLVLFFITHCIYFYGIFAHNQIIPSYIGLFSIVISVAYSIWIYKSNTNPKTEEL